MRRVFALSQERFSNLNCNDDTVEKFEDSYFISIFGSNVSPFFNQTHPNVLLIQTDDIDQPHDDLLLFTNDQAKETIEFLRCLPDDFTLVVHCGAGVCRSGAVADFASSMLHVDYNTFKNDNPHILPNIYILQTLRMYYLEHYSSFSKY